MLSKQARMVCRKKWAAKHECEELKAGFWLEPIQSMLRRKTNEFLDKKAPKCDVGGRTGSEENVRYWLVERIIVSRLQQGRKHGEAQALPIVRHGGKSETRSQRVLVRRRTEVKNCRRKTGSGKDPLG